MIMRALVWPEQEEEDLMGRLPDDIIICHIIPCMQFKDAVATSVVSKRWRHLWKFTTNLHLDVPAFPPEGDEPEFSRRLTSFVRAVNPPFELLNYLKRVRVRFEPTPNPSLRGKGVQNVDRFFRVIDVIEETLKSGPVVQKWLEFVSAKRVELLELDFSWNDAFRGNILYTMNIPKISAAGFESLKDLTLKCIALPEKIVYSFLHNCPLLERLSLQHCRVDGHLIRVVGPSSPLKCLELRDCWTMQSNLIQEIVIANVPNLAQLIYSGMDHLLWSPVINAPSLIDVVVSEPVDSSPTFHNCYTPISSGDCFSQLETLTVEINSGYTFSDFKTSSFKLPGLKKLVLKISKRSDDCLLQYACLVECSPRLEKFVLHTLCENPCINKERTFQRKLNVKSSHQQLKKVELVDYYGRKSDLEFIVYFIENTVSLENIIIHLPSQWPGLPFMMGKHIEKQERNKARRSTGSKLAMRTREDLQKLVQVPSGFHLEFRYHR